MLFRESSFDDLYTEELARLREVNHCHGTGTKGHPCSDTSPTHPLLKMLDRLKLRPKPYRRPVFRITPDGRLVSATKETWSDAARLASIASRRAHAIHAEGEQQKAKKKQQSAAARAKQDAYYKQQGATAAAGSKALRQHVQDAETQHQKAVAAQAQDLANIHKAKQDAAAKAAAAKKAASGSSSKADAAAKQATAAKYDAQINPLVNDLNRMAAAGQQATPEYRAKYNQYRQLKAAKAQALGQSFGPLAPRAPRTAQTGSRSSRAARGTAPSTASSVGPGQRVQRVTYRSAKQ